MGLPTIEVVFKQLAVSAIKRSERGIAAIIIRDDTLSKTDITKKPTDPVWILILRDIPKPT